MVSDVLVYWRDYRKNVQDDRVHGWYSNSKVVGKLEEGDCLWMVTSGKCLGDEATQAGFLVAVWDVTKKAENNPDDDPPYPAAEYKYRVATTESSTIKFDDPVLVDHILRPDGKDTAISIGTFLQGPRKLNDETVRLLKAAVELAR